VRLAGTLVLFALTTATFAQTNRPASAPAVTNTTTLGKDANGNTLRLATKTGHVSNYEEEKVGTYTLPDPLVLANGQPVRDADTWFKRRRPEILKLYEAEIYGRVPDNAPKVRWDVAATTNALGGTAILKGVTGHVGNRADGPKLYLNLYLPAKATEPVPVVFCLDFGYRRVVYDAPITVVLARGWAYAMMYYTDIQPDRAGTFTNGVIGLTLPPGQTSPEPDQWGTISAWAWGISRVIDYLETDKSVDAKRVAIQGYSRLGKTVLWAGAQDARVAAVYSSCSGEMGAALARRDYGETVDDMAQNYGYQFAGNFQKWAGHWNDMPVDAHMLIALNAPHGVFITGGETDRWSDPKGEFLATVAAGPVYRLVGKKDLSVTELPPLDQTLTGGDLGWVYHTGGHTAPRSDWNAFLDFAAKYFSDGSNR